jgi:tRNA pseudouridine55 synthase
MNGVLAVWKPTDISSFDVIRKIKSYNKYLKIGHCGTLDPFAEGVLIICIGSFTKKVPKYMSQSKKYVASIIFGKETDTLDLKGRFIKSTNSSKKIKLADIELIMKNFIGTTPQIPPYFSAKKINNIKMYEFARNDIFIRAKPVDVHISSIKILDFCNNILTLDIECSKGTYIRSLARDIAYSLDTYGYLISLSRTSIGDFNEQNSIKFKDLEKCMFIN